MILVGLLLLCVGVSGYFLMVNHESKIIENQALSVAEIVARQTAAARATYVNNIISKVAKDGVAYTDFEHEDKKGALPIPAQFVKIMAQKAAKASEGIYRFRTVSERNIGAKADLNNDFLKFAWAELEKQDQANPQKPIDWKPIYNVQKVEGQETLLYLKAAPAFHESCVTCHNDYEQTSDVIALRKKQNIEAGKVLKKHQLLGAMFIEIPVESMMAAASRQSKIIMLWIFGVLTLGLGALAFFFTRDLVKAREARERLFWQAKHDALTHLPNRNSFEHEADSLVADAALGKTTHALCFLDLDHFKLVNDTCGHAAGDELLRDISQLLLSRLDEDGFMARLGGDEFAVLLKNCDIAEATSIAQKLCDTVKAYHFTKNEQSFDIGVSIGVNMIDQHSGSVESITRCADLACYAAKDAGKNRIHVYLEDDAKLSRKAGEVSWVSEMKRALDENRIIIYSQRIGSVSNDTQHVHHEILVRLIDRTGEVILPDNFIPAAERYKMMHKLDLAIIDRAFSALSSNYFKDLGETGFISINLSGQSFSESDFLTNVKHLMMSYRVNTKQICFEITESAAVENMVLVQQFMTEMKRLGVKFALDDFGTGLSSLTYLKQFPVDYLKIDGSFIKDILNGDIDRTLVDGMNKMAHTMGLKTIAEYVESKDILDLLDTLNVDYAQGYYIQKPERVKVAY